MEKRLSLILGGARSGKSTYAQKMAGELSQRVLFVATAVAFDEEMTTRIAAHQAERPSGWRTLEVPSMVGQAIRAAPGQEEVVLLDCVTLLVNNVILALPAAEDGSIDASAAAATVDAEIDDLLEVIAASQREWIIVSNEVGLGLVPAYPLGRIYRDVLGRANQKIAQAADRVILMVAGIPMKVK